MKVILQTVNGERIEYDSQQRSFQPWEAMPCLRCGTCCTKWQPPLAEDEIETIATGVGMMQDDFVQEYVQEYPPKPGTYLLRRQNNACVFLKHEGGKATCTIHPFRPEACRNWAPSLSRPECQEGLRRRGEDGLLLLPDDLPLSPQEKANFCRLGQNCSIIGGT